MSKKFKKNEIEDLEPVVDTPQTTGAQERKIPFAHWFDRQVQAHKLRSYQDEALLVFFKKQGLKNIEDEDTYNRALEKF